MSVVTQKTVAREYKKQIANRQLDVFEKELVRLDGEQNKILQQIASAKRSIEIHKKLCGL